MNEVAERVMDSTDLEREKVTILAKTLAAITATSRSYRRHPWARRLRRRSGNRLSRWLRVLLLGTPRGPLSPRLVSCCARRLGSAAACLVVATRSTGPDPRPAEVLDDVYDLFIDLGADDGTSRSRGRTATPAAGQGADPTEEVAECTDLKILFEPCSLSYIPRLRYIEGHPFRRWSATDASRTLAAWRSPGPPGLVNKKVNGRLVRQGRRRRPQRCGSPSLYMTDGLHRVDAGPKAQPCDIIALAGIPEINDRRHPRRCQRPAPSLSRGDRGLAGISMDDRYQYRASAGMEGTKLCSAPKGRLDSELVGKRSIPGAAHGASGHLGSARGAVSWAGRARRAHAPGGFNEHHREVKTPGADKDNRRQGLRPVERVSLDIPEELLGTVMQFWRGRKGRMFSM